MIEAKKLFRAGLLIACALPAIAAAREDSIERKVAAEPNGEVVISNTAGTIDVRGCDRNEVQVTGTFDCCGGGTIDGRMVGAVITFTWRQANGAWGRGIWTAAEGRITGNWGWDGGFADGGTWDLAPRPVMAMKTRR